MKRLFIISGGVGSEREVSLSSGRNCLEVLAASGISCEAIIVTDNKSFVYNNKVMRESECLEFLRKENALVFQVIHGTYGEDGEFVKKLEEYGISYIGSSSLVLEKTINKYETGIVLQTNTIATPHSLILKKVESVDTIDTSNIDFPAIIKPNKEGSSVGVLKVRNEEELRLILDKGLNQYEEVLVQKCIQGREFTCGVIEIDGKTIALPVTEIILTKGDVFDYHAKYTPNACLEVTPATIDDSLREKIQQTALLVHRVTGCRDISRTDLMLNEIGELVVLEINTIPGMTKTSFVPAQMKASGHALKDFIEGMLIKYS